MKYFIQRLKNLFKPLQQRKGIWIAEDLFPLSEKGKWYGVSVSLKRLDNEELVLDDLSIWQFKTKNKVKKVLGYINGKKAKG